MLDKLTALRSDMNRGLTVEDLLVLLRKFDPDTPVFLPGENGGLEAVEGMRLAAVRLFVNSADGFGPHEVCTADEPADGLAVVIGSAGR